MNTAEMNTYALAPRHDWERLMEELPSIAKDLVSTFHVVIVGCGRFTMQFKTTESTFQAICKAYRENYTVEPTVWYAPATVAKNR